MKFNVEAKGYHESMHHYWQLYSLRLYNGNVAKKFFLKSSLERVCHISSIKLPVCSSDSFSIILKRNIFDFLEISREELPQIHTKNVYIFTEM